jgi:hypothetical protein
VSFLVALLFPPRIGRVSYFIRDCVIALLVWGVLGSSLSNESHLIVAILFLIAYVYWLFWVVLPRIRDLSMPPFWLILMLVPVLNVVFALVLTFQPSAIAYPQSTDTPPTKMPLC